MVGKLATLTTAVFGIGLVLGLLVRPLFLPWVLAAGVFYVNQGLALPFLPMMGRLKASAAAALAVLSFLLRFGLIALGLLLVALALPDYFVATAICFLIIYTGFVGLEVIAGLKSRSTVNRGVEA